MHFTLHLTELQAAMAWNTSIVLAAAAAFFVHWKEGKRRGFESLTWLTFLALVYASIIFGERIGAFGLSDWEALFAGEGLPAVVKKTFLGSVLLMLPVVFLLKKWWRLPVGMVDAFLLPIPLAAAIGRIGCFLAGCCFGKPTGAGWGVNYGAGTSAHDWQVAQGIIPEGAAETVGAYPVQLYFVVSGLVGFALLWHLRKRMKQPGQLALATMVFVFANRFFIEFFREAVTGRGFIGEMAGGLKLGQWFCLAVVLVSLLVYCWREFNFRPIAQAAKSKSAPQFILPKAGLLLTVAIGGLLLSPVLTLEEEVILLMVCSPALYFLGKKIWRMPSRRKAIAPAAMLSMATIALAAVPLDTLPPMGKGQHWIELGAGGTTGAYSIISRDCDGNIIDEDKVKFQSLAFDGSVNWGIRDGRAGIGLRGASGTSEPEVNANLEDRDFSFNAMGMYAILDTRGIGLKGGAMYIDRAFAPTVAGDENDIVPIIHLRFGKIARLHVDYSNHDNQVFSFYPQPIGGLGVAYGFDDPSGAKQLRGAFVVIDEESGFSISGRHPIGQSRWVAEGGLAFRRNAIFSMGLRYRFYLKE